MEEAWPSLRIVESGPSQLALVGELDIASVPELEARLRRCAGDVVLNCAGLTFADASGLSLFLRVRSACETRGVTFALVEPSPCLLRLLTITGLDELFLTGVGGLRQ